MITGPLLLWLSIQLIALALAALGVPLAAHYIQPPQSQALGLLFVVQISAASLLFPLLCRSWQSATAAAFVAVPTLSFAAALAAEPISAMTPLAVDVGLWLTGLAIWRCTLNPSWQLRFTSFVFTVTVGGALLWYLRAEFVDNGIPPNHSILFGPLIGGARWDAVGMIAGGTSVWIILRLVRNRRKSGAQSH